MRSTLSVVLATYNEEKNLPSCLDSIKDIVDEIVIVDGTSQDKTVEVAKKYKARVKITTNKQNFHINKQMAIDMATKDWVLQLDADEHVSKELKEEILEVLKKDSESKKTEEQINGYWMPRKNMFLGKFLMKGGQYPDYTMRFYRRGKGKLPQKDVHEQAEVEGKIDYLKSALLHHPYKNFLHYLKKWDLYNQILATQIKDELSSKNIFEKIFLGFLYLFIRPTHWLFTTFLRHKGFMDGLPGFVFSFFSALRFPVSYIKYIGPYRFWAAVIIFLSAAIRFYEFGGRVGLGGDEGRDALIALEAIHRRELPLTSSFSSAGPFVFGGIYYWFIMASYLILPFFVFAPWVFLGLVSILTVIILMYLGKILLGSKYSLLIGILAGLSPQLVSRSLALTVHTFIPIFTSLSLISFLLLWKTKKLIHSFLLGVWIGLALSFHYQSINLFIFFPALLFITTVSVKERLKSTVLSIVGFLAPSAPLLYWDSLQNFANFRNVLDYFFIGQYRLYVPNSWRIFIFEDIPEYWAFVVGHFPLLGLALFLGSIFVFIAFLLRKKISNEFSFVGIIFLLLLFINRFYKGERSEGYLLYLLPFILIFTAFFIYQLVSNKNNIVKILGLGLLFLIIVFNLIALNKIYSVKSHAFYVNKIKTYLYNRYPRQKFSIYDYKHKNYYTSMPLALFLNFDNKLNPTGKKLGLSCYEKDCPQDFPIIYEEFPIVDLSSAKPSDLDQSKKIWINVNKSSVYEDLIGWLNKGKLKSSFSLSEYLKTLFNK